MRYRISIQSFTLIWLLEYFSGVKKTSRQRDWETYGWQRERNMLFRHLHTIFFTSLPEIFFNLAKRNNCFTRSFHAFSFESEFAGGRAFARGPLLKKKRKKEKKKWIECTENQEYLRPWPFSFLQGGVPQGWIDFWKDACPELSGLSNFLGARVWRSSVCSASYISVAAEHIRAYHRRPIGTAQLWVWRKNRWKS